MPANSLRCRICETEHELGPFAVCSRCFGPLDPTYDWDALAGAVTRDSIAAGPPSLWRYADLLPVAPPARPRLAPGYTPAIEYRAEAYLGLDQVEDAKKAHMDLFPNDRSHADELLVAMKGWVQKRQTDPGKMTPEMVQSFSSWVQEREELAKQTPSVSELQNRKW